MEKQTGTQAETNLVDEDCNGGLNRELSGGRGGGEGTQRECLTKLSKPLAGCIP